MAFNLILSHTHTLSFSLSLSHLSSPNNYNDNDNDVPVGPLIVFLNPQEGQEGRGLHDNDNDDIDNDNDVPVGPLIVFLNAKEGQKGRGLHVIDVEIDPVSALCGPYLVHIALMSNKTDNHIFLK